MKKILLMILITVFLFSFMACKKQEEETVSQSPAQAGPLMDTPTALPGYGAPVQKSKLQVVVPPDVKEEWSQVTIIVEDKKENRKEEFTVNIGGEFKIPGSKLTVKTGPFLPDFKMSGTAITSSSNEPNNPTVGVAVFEDGKKLFPASGEWGWLYAKFPTVHSFQHERYGLILKEGIKK
ncbi:MAG TPA: DUF2155 domain-containing protein [Nitrospirae bacterium]|nr:DUF2155 domain-containing protein [Nitrospirota bacterium]